MTRARGGEGLALACAIAVFAAACARLLHLIDAHAVNVLFWDQWDLIEPWMRDAGAWELFRYQHGPHRQGVAFVGAAWLAELTRWNTRVEAFAICGLVCAAAACALWLQRRLRGRLRVGDAAIPLLLLTPAQYGIFLHTPNASHGAAPLLLLVLFALTLTVERRVLRHALLVVLNLNLVHTGFGFFAGLITPAYFALEWRRARRSAAREDARSAAISGLLCLATLGLFFANWRPATAGGPLALAPGQVPQLLRYVTLMFANVCGVKGTGALAIAVGALPLLLSIAILLRHLRALLGPPQAHNEQMHSEVAVALIGFGLLFCTATAVGRLTFGIPGAQSTRYVPLVAPAFVGILLELAHWSEGAPPRWRRPIAALVVFAVVAATTPMRAHEARFLERLSKRKARWVEGYLYTRRIQIADRFSRLHIYHRPPEETRLQEKLDFLEARGLNFFANAQARPAEPEAGRRTQ